MADRADFDDYVTARSPRLLKVAYLLTRDHALAEDLLQTALARAWRAWRRIEGDPEPYVRRILVNTYNTWWRRHWMTEQPTDSPPETPIPATANDDRDEVLRALGRLPRQQRTVMVLRYYEDMSEAQIAQTMSISEGSVKGYAAKALAKLRVDPALAALATPLETPVGMERLAGVQARIKHHRRQLITIGAACVVVLALIFGYAVAPHLKAQSLPPTRHKVLSAKYANGYRIVAAKDYQYGDTRLILTWRPSTLDIANRIDCRHDLENVAVRWTLTANGRELYGGFCDDRDTGEGGFSMIPADKLSAAGVVLGEEAIFELRLGKTEAMDPFFPSQSTGEVPASMKLNFALGASTPYEQYRFPKRPDQLKPLVVPVQKVPRIAMLSSKGPRSVDLTWGKELWLIALSQTPGRMKILVNGQVRWTFTWWDYEKQRNEVTDTIIQPGDRVTITVEPEDLTGEWQLDIYPN